MSIVKLNSPASTGEGEKGGSGGWLIGGILVALALYFGIKHFNKPKIEEKQPISE